MIDSSKAYKKAIRENGRIMSIHDDYTFKDGSKPDISTESFMKYSINEATSDSSTFSIGATVIKKYVASLSNMDGLYDMQDFEGLDIVARVGLLLPDGSVEITPKGRYRCVNAKVIENTIDIEAYDSMLFFDRPYSESTLNYPASILAIIQDACLCCQMTFDASSIKNGDLIISERPDDDNLTFRDVIGYCAQMMCCYAIIDKLDQLSFGWYDFVTLEKLQNGYDGGSFDTNSVPYNDGDIIDGGDFLDYSTGDTVDGGTFEELGMYHHLYSLSSQSINTDEICISGINVKLAVSDTEYLYGEAGYILSIEENPLIQTDEMAEYIATYIGERMIGKKFRPLCISCQSNPCIEAGDCACVTDRKSRTFFTVITNTTFSFGTLQKIESTAESYTEKTYTKYSAVTKILNKTKKETKVQLSQYDLAVQQLTNLITNSFGVFKTEEKLEDGSVIYYLHDKTELSSSTKIWKMTADAFAVSSDGGKTWNAGLDSEGNAVVNVLSAIGINADWLIAGLISDKKGLNKWDLDNGVVSFESYNASIKKNEDEIALRVKSGDVVSEVNQSAEQITLKGNRIVVESDNWSVSANGSQTCKNIEIIGGTITGSTILLTHENQQNVLKVRDTAGMEVRVDGDGVYAFPSTDGIASVFYNNGLAIGDCTINSDGGHHVDYKAWYNKNLSIPGTKSRIADTENYGNRLLYCYETPTPMFGDIGEGKLDETGKCYVFLDDIFGETIDADCTYQIFLQPYGKGTCYVIERNPSYFIVEGTENLSFGWELKAVQRDYDTIRLEECEGLSIESDTIAETEAYLYSLVNEEDTVVENEIYLESLVYQESEEEI